MTSINFTPSAPPIDESSNSFDRSNNPEYPTPSLINPFTGFSSPWLSSFSNKLTEIFPQSAPIINTICSPGRLFTGSLTSIGDNSYLSRRPSFSNGGESSLESGASRDFGRQPPSLKDALVGTIALLARDSLSLVAGSSLVRINNKEDEARIKGVHPPFSASRALENAKAMLFNDVPYHMLTNNCEHYVTRWKYGGLGWSVQTHETAIKLCFAFQSLYHSYREGAPVLPSIRTALQRFRKAHPVD